MPFTAALNARLQYQPGPKCGADSEALTVQAAEACAAGGYPNPNPVILTLTRPRRVQRLGA